MTEEEYFRKNYPDSCYGDKPLSPHWDFFQDGVEFGERQSEKRIAELEEKLKRAEENCINKTCVVFKDKEDCVAKLLELEKENAELKTKKIPQLERRIASIRGSHSVDAKKLNARIEQVERLKKENAELKILVSSMLYEINALWDISEMNEDVRKHAERVDSEVNK